MVDSGERARGDVTTYQHCHRGQPRQFGASDSGPSAVRGGDRAEQCAAHIPKQQFFCRGLCGPHPMHRSEKISPGLFVGYRHPHHFTTFPIQFNIGVLYGPSNCILHREIIYSLGELAPQFISGFIDRCWGIAPYCLLDICKAAEVKYFTAIATVYNQTICSGILGGYQRRRQRCPAARSRSACARVARSAERGAAERRYAECRRVPQTRPAMQATTFHDVATRSITLQCSKDTLPAS